MVQLVQRRIKRPSHIQVIRMLVYFKIFTKLIYPWGNGELDAIHLHYCGKE